MRFASRTVRGCAWVEDHRSAVAPTPVGDPARRLCVDHVTGCPRLAATTCQGIHVAHPSYSPATAARTAPARPGCRRPLGVWGANTRAQPGRCRPCGSCGAMVGWPARSARMKRRGWAETALKPTAGVGLRPQPQGRDPRNHATQRQSPKLEAGRMATVPTVGSRRSRRAARRAAPPSSSRQLWR
jgi:hypothetical protein